MKRKVTLETEVVVGYSNPEKAHQYFIEGDWKNTFFDLDDLEDLTEFLALAVFQHPEGFRLVQFGVKGNEYRFVKEMEGFATFIKDENGANSWVSEHDVYGAITVHLEELEVSFSPEVVE